MPESSLPQPVILSAVRTPIGKFQGGLASLSATQLGAKVVAEAARRAGIEPAARRRPRPCTGSRPSC